MICSKFQTPGQTMRTDGEPADFFYQLDDPAFLAERARLRSRLEHVPENAIGRRRLERLYEAMTEEFCRRARIAWTRSRLAGAGRVRDLLIACVDGRPAAWRGHAGQGWGCGWRRARILASSCLAVKGLWMKVGWRAGSPGGV
jgi:hypothetical protein